MAGGRLTSTACCRRKDAISRQGEIASFCWTGGRVIMAHQEGPIEGTIIFRREQLHRTGEAQIRISASSSSAIILIRGDIAFRSLLGGNFSTLGVGISGNATLCIRDGGHAIHRVIREGSDIFQSICDCNHSAILIIGIAGDSALFIRDFNLVAVGVILYAGNAVFCILGADNPVQGIVRIDTVVLPFPSVSEVTLPLPS